MKPPTILSTSSLRFAATPTSTRAKLTIDLSGRALDTLERLMQSSGFGSRGRTIEEAILATDELSRLADLLSNLLPKNTGTLTPEQTTRLIMAIQTFMTYYVA